MMTTNEQYRSDIEPFAVLRGSRVVLLTSFRRDGQGIGTPVGFNLANGIGYFTTWTTTGKVKRIAYNPRVTLAPCTRAGKVIGPTVAGIARQLDSAEAARVLTMLRPGLWGWLWNVIYRLQRR